MKNQRRIMRWATAVILTIAIPFRAAIAQDIVEVTTQVIPPFEAGFSNFHSKVLVTLRNTTSRLIECRLSGTLTSGSITITLAESGVPPIILTANQVVQLTGPQLAPYFQEANVTVSGITKQELYHGNGLPGGTYQLCLRAVNIFNGEFLSSPAPSGCFPFTIQQSIPEDAVRLTTQVIPPYSTYLEDYINQNRLIVVLQNRSGTPQELRLTGSIKGNNGVTITIPPSFVPSKPILLSPRQVLQLIGNDLREYFSEDVLQYAGISREDVARGNGLPEGNYQLCLQALDYNSGEPRSPGSPLGCAIFDLRQFEPPFIIQPACNTTVNTTQPQNILFTWSIPAGARPDLVEYVLKIVEMYPQNMDPNQAMQAANIPPLFEKVVRTNSYIYSLADPKLEPGKTYAFRVTARMNTTSRQARRSAPLNFRNNGNSQVCTFTFGAAPANEIAVEEITLVHEGFQRTRVNVDPSDVLTVPAAQSSMAPDPEDSQACAADCSLAAPANTSSKSIVPGDEVKVGKFTMTVASGNTTAGTGTIAVNFLNTPINVHWNNIQVNTDNEVFGNASKITAVMDIAALAGNAVTTQPTPNPNIGQIGTLMQTAQQASRKVSMFPASNSQAIGLPVALDHGNFDLIIVGLIFTPTGATMNAITGVELTNSTSADDFLILASSNCIRPNGFGDDTELVLTENKTIPLSNHVSMILQEDVTRASFDCQGIESLEVSGTLRFDRDLVLPVNGSGEVVGGGTRLSASFTSTITDYNNWTASIGSLSHAFTIPELIGFKFEATNLTLDHSFSSNPAGANNAFPQNYPGGNAWTGIYIGGVNVALPASLKSGNSTISFNASHVLLDKNGFTGDINPPAGILANGKLGGWNFSINNVSLEIVSSTLAGAGMGGTLQLPISIDNLEYEVAFETSTSETDEVEFHFQVSKPQTVDVDMWFAELDLDAASTIGIGKEGMVYRPEAILHGEMTVAWNTNSASKPQAGTSAVSNINIPDLRFENLRITGGTSPSISLSGIDLDNYDNAQAGLANFPLVLNSVNLDGLDQSNIKLQFDMDLSLNAEGNGISGGTLFSIVGEFTDGHYNYDHTELNEVSIDVDVGVAYLLGSIQIFNNDAVYGDGFRGSINAHINAINLGMDAALQIGRTTGANSYRYWYFDLMLHAGTGGIPIPGTAAAIYGLGGGAYHNMTRNVMEEMAFSSFNNNPSYNDTPGSSVYGSTFTPSEGSFGFNAAVAFGLAGTPAAFNGDVKFSMELDQDGSFDNVVIEGGGYVMQDLTGDRDDAFIKGSVKVVIVPHDEAKPFPTPVFHLETEDPFSINIASIVTGQIPLAMHFDPEVWHVKLGEWENYNEPWEDTEKRIMLGVDLKVFSLDFYGYFMMGNDIPEIPPMPAVVRDVFGMSETTTPRSDVLGTNNSGGIAFGSGYHFQTDPRLKFLIFYADVFFATGFDVTLKHYQGDMGCGDGFGIHGWYAKGQMYSYLDLDVGLEVKVWFTDGKLKLSLLQATAAAALQAQLPNPTWVKGQFAISGSVLNGLIKVNTSFKFELGEKCLPDSGNPFDEMPIISEVNPGNGDTKVSVFTNPEIAFNFPNEEFSVEEIKDDGSTVVRTFYYTFESFVLKYKDDEGNNKTMDITNWKNYRQDGNSAVFVSSEILPPDRPISYEIRVRGWEKVYGPNKLLVTEKKEGTFTTDKFPDHILFSHIKSSTPGYRQRYFLKDEYQKGEVNLMYNYSEHFDPEFWYEDVWELGNYVNSAVSGSFSWKARFRELATGNVYESTATINGDGTRIRFDIPNGLKNSAIYKADIVVVYNPPVTDLAAPGVATNTYASYKNVIISGSGGGGGSGTIGGIVAANQGVGGGAGDPGVQFAGSQSMAAASSGGQQMVAANYQLAQQVNPGGMQDLIQQYDQPNGMYQVSLNKGMLIAPTGPGQATGGVSIQRMNRRLLASDESSKTAEHNLFKFFFAFKTSMYNTKKQKIESIEVLEIPVNKVPVTNYATFYPGTAVSTDVPVALLGIVENFDAYELYGKKWGNSDYGGFVEPAFKISYDPHVDNWLEDFSRDLYDMPDDEEWEQMVIKDEFGVPIEWTVDRPTPDWEDYIPSVDDWDPHRHKNKWYPFGKREFPTAFQIWNESYGEPTLEFYKGSIAHGSIDWKGENVVLPDGPLSAEEVLDAMDAAPTPPSGNLNQFQMNTGQTPPSAGNPQYANPALPKRIAVIDYTEWLTMRDYYLFRKHIHDRNLELLPSPSDPEHNEYHDLIFVPIEYYLQKEMYYKNRPGGQFRFEIEGVEFPYDVPELNEEGGISSEY